MATPTNPDADEARWYHMRERRRKLQDLSEFKTAGLIPPDGTPHNFGNVFPNGESQFQLELPANVDITLIHAASVPAGQIGVTDQQSGVSYSSTQTSQANGRIEINHLFAKDRFIRIERGASAPAGTVLVYFSGPKSQLSQFGVATFL